MRLSQPFVQLPFRFDAGRLAEEARALPASAWMPHPSGLRGNAAVALVSRDGGANDDFTGAMAETAALRACPYTRQAMAAFDEVLGRSRFMRLAPGCEVAAHVDFNYHWRWRVRIHVPVVTTPAVRFRCGDEERHLQAGESWIFDSWRRHRVVNGGTEDRIHLVVDVAGSSRFWNTVRAACAAPPEPVFVPFDPAAAPRLRTERHPVAAVMAPGELEALTRELLADLAANAANDAALLARYERLLLDLCCDWRALWFERGADPNAHSAYAALLGAVRRQLHPDPRALVTASNGVGANPVIVQRLLAAALPPQPGAEGSGYQSRSVIG